MEALGGIADTIVNWDSHVGVGFLVGLNVFLGGWSIINRDSIFHGYECTTKKQHQIALFIGGSLDL